MSERPIKVNSKEQRQKEADYQRRHELSLLKLLLEKHFPKEVPKLFPKTATRQ